jgi:hypothetical protein
MILETPLQELQQYETLLGRMQRQMEAELERRIESSFDFEGWREERQVLLLALKGALLADPKANAMALEALDKLEIADERDFQLHDLPDALSAERKKPRTG